MENKKCLKPPTRYIWYITLPPRYVGLLSPNTCFDFCFVAMNAYFQVYNFKKPLRNEILTQSSGSGSLHININGKIRTNGPLFLFDDQRVILWMVAKSCITLDGWNPMNNGMFTTVFNWCRISQPSTVAAVAPGQLQPFASQARWSQRRHSSSQRGRNGVTLPGFNG